MDGIADLFAELSQPDEFHVQAQLELFAWRAAEYERERKLSPWHRYGRRLGSARYRSKNRDVIHMRDAMRRRLDAEWKARRAKSNAEYVARKKDSGKCSRCSDACADGKRMCQRHLEQERERNRRRAEARAA